FRFLKGNGDHANLFNANSGFSSTSLVQRRIEVLVHVSRTMTVYICERFCFLSPHLLRAEGNLPQALCRAEGYLQYHYV
ncbi:MAG: hypothetical protein AAB209_05265, partial [Bacteroidota bacterium]